MFQPETLSSYLEIDHDRLMILFNQYQSFKVSDALEAKRLFEDFMAGLKRHIKWEEEIIFPLFKLKMTLHDQDSIMPTKLEHQHILESLRKLHLKIQEENPDTVEDENELIQFLSNHSKKEDATIYPLLDRMINAYERTQIVKSLKSFS